jgi:hypothetical protein
MCVYVLSVFPCWRSSSVVEGARRSWSLYRCDEKLVVRNTIKITPGDQQAERSACGDIDRDSGQGSIVGQEMNSDRRNLLLEQQNSGAR